MKHFAMSVVEPDEPTVFRHKGRFLSYSEVLALLNLVECTADGVPVGMLAADAPLYCPHCGDRLERIDDLATRCIGCSEYTPEGCIPCILYYDQVVTVPGAPLPAPEGTPDVDDLPF